MTDAKYLATVAAVEAWRPKLGAAKAIVCERRWPCVRLSLGGESTAVACRPDFLSRGETVASHLDRAERRFVSRVVGVPVVGVVGCRVPGEVTR